MHKKITERQPYYEAVIRKYLPKEEGKAKLLREAMNYSILAGGKRLRPMLMAETCKLFSADTTGVEPFMAAIECMHTASLVHDDLPAIDNDDYRRGRKATHAAYGEDVAVLAGDALLNYAFEILCEEMAHTAYPERYGKAMACIAKAGGIDGMLGGQFVDVVMTGKSLNQETLNYIFSKKTGAFIAASMEVGAIMGGASPKQQAQLRLTGEKIGFAFQIQDDCLDVTGDAANLGKPIGSDEKNHKTTYVTLYGLEQALEDANRLTQEAIAIVLDIDKNAEFLPELFTYLQSREK